MNTTAYAELEISLHFIEAASYQVELRFTDPESEAEIPPARGPATLDFARLLALQHHQRAYGESLAGQLFDNEGVRGLYRHAQTAVEASGRFLRLRLTVAPDAAELHALRWELLCDPESKTPLASSEKTPFSRFMVSHDWRPVKLRPKADLRALVAVAAPFDLAKYQLSEVDREAEIERAVTALEGIDVAVLGRDQPLDVERLLERLRTGIDILYLVCHGALIRQVPRLYLQGEDGGVAVADGSELARRIAELPETPRLVVLASCDSAAAADGKLTAEAALAPRLAKAGVPAILAMQGKISMRTVEKAMPVFFTELLEDGQIDRALAVARGTVRDRSDAWMPALFMRLKGGRIWYVPGFAGEGTDFEKWKSICRSVRQGKFIPILGHDVGEHVFGTVRDLAEQMAEASGFPLAIQDRSDLAKVIQYLSINQDRKYAMGELLKQLRKQLLEHNREILGNGAGDLPLPALLDAISRSQRQDKSDPFRILSELDASVYVNASPETLLYKSLKEAGRKPRLLYCEWRPTEASHPTEPPCAGKPTPGKPIVYHMFGVFGRPDSLVLTEDDFFDYLIASSAYKLTPTVVRGLLTESSLLFLGFRLDDWTFRILFRLIMTMEGCADLKEYSHVGVQMDPEEHSLGDVERARRYLESYFAIDRGHGRGEPRIEIYWGTVATFLNELRDQLDRTEGDTGTFRGEEEYGDGWF